MYRQVASNSNPLTFVYDIVTVNFIVSPDVFIGLYTFPSSSDIYTRSALYCHLE
jgi:hypothetical protein